MILRNIKKGQQGGVLPKAQTLDTKVPSFTGILAISKPTALTAGSTGRRNTGRTAGQSSTNPGLVSDRLYTENRIKELNEKISKMDPNSIEYKTALTAVRDLALQHKNSAKINETLYRDAKTGVRSAPGTIATDGSSVVVKDLTNTDDPYKILSYEDLMSNGKVGKKKRYQLLTLGEVYDLRSSDPDFSGYTDNGKFVDALIKSPVGHANFQKGLDGVFKNVGYYKDGKLKNNKDAIANAIHSFISLHGDNTYLKGQALQNIYNNSIVSGTSVSNIDEALNKEKGNIIQTLANSKLEDGDGDVDGDGVEFYENDLHLNNYGASLYKAISKNVEGAKFSNGKGKLTKLPAFSVHKGDEMMRTGWGGTGMPTAGTELEVPGGYGITSNQNLRNVTGDENIDKGVLADGTLIKKENLALATYEEGNGTALVYVPYVNGIPQPTYYQDNEDYRNFINKVDEKYNEYLKTSAVTDPEKLRLKRAMISDELLKDPDISLDTKELMKKITMKMMISVPVIGFFDDDKIRGNDYMSVVSNDKAAKKLLKQAVGLPGGWSKKDKIRSTKVLFPVQESPMIFTDTGIADAVTLKADTLNALKKAGVNTTIQGKSKQQSTDEEVLRDNTKKDGGTLADISVNTKEGTSINTQNGNEVFVPKEFIDSLFEQF